MSTMEKTTAPAPALERKAGGTAGDPLGRHGYFLLGGWHFGGTLPMCELPKSGQCKPSGEVCGLAGVYVVDSAAFPEIPGSTIALLISAHAHHVAQGWIIRQTGAPFYAH